MEKKPNQIIDEITNVIYPPKEAIVSQLITIRAIIPPTIKMYESTEDIHTIQPNLDMIQRAINYLRGVPMQDNMKPVPEDTIKPVYIPSSPGFFITSAINKDGEYDVSIVGVEVEQKILHPDLFGEVDFPATEMNIQIPVTCGKTYLISQENPALAYYTDDPYVIQPEEGVYVKEKQYNIEEDSLEYVFLLMKGRTKVRIAIYADYENPIIFNITSHIHFKMEEELPPEEELPDEDSGSNG